MDTKQLTLHTNIINMNGCNVIWNDEQLKKKRKKDRNAMQTITVINMTKWNNKITKKCRKKSKTKLEVNDEVIN